MAGKFAVIVGISDYEDPKLSRLCCPSADVVAFSEVLKDAGLGAFDQVVTCVNKERIVVERAITSLYSNKHPDDLVLLYFSGHGIRDDEGDLYLAVKDTDHTDLDGTAVIASFVARVMNKSSSRRQLVILDCCHSGAFSSGFKGVKGEEVGASVGTKAVFDPEGYGRVVLTASDATQYAWEGDKILGDAQNSLYTHFLIEGIRSGAADLRGDGRITVDELHDYVYRKVVESASKQRPEKFGAREEGQLVLSKAPLRPAPLPLEIQSSLNNSLSVNARRAVIDDLVSLIRHGSRGQALSAHAALASLLEDDSRSVRHAADRAMASYTGAQLDIDQDVLDRTANDARNSARLQRGDSGRVSVDSFQDDEKLDAEARERQRAAERERLAREAQERAVKAERERLAREDQERAVKAEQDLAREFQQRKLKAEQEKLARETQEREQRAEQEKAEQQRLAKEVQEIAVKAERERLAREDQERAVKAEQDLAREFQQRKLKAEQERLARGMQERERNAEQEKAEQQRAEQQKTEQEKEQQKAEQQKAEQERIAREARLKADQDASVRARKSKKWMLIAIGCFIFWTFSFLGMVANSDPAAGGAFLVEIALFVWTVIAYGRHRKAKLGL